MPGPNQQRRPKSWKVNDEAKKKGGMTAADAARAAGTPTTPDSYWEARGEEARQHAENEAIKYNDPELRPDMRP